MNESFLSKLKMVTLKDIGHLFLFVLALIPAAVYKRFRPHLWLVCEAENEARDNGYWFFRYLRAEQPQVDAVYAIKNKSPEADKVRTLGNTVAYGSYKHWIYYLSAEVICSSVKGGKPSAAAGYLIEVVLKLHKPNYVFLQHGVITSDIASLHADKCAFSMFCCGAAPEYEYVKDTFGYSPDQVKYLGLTRFDGLFDAQPDKDLVLIVPTWRMYLQRNSRSMEEDEFLETLYYKEWAGLLHSGELDRLLEKYGKRAVFCLHRNMQSFEKYFLSQSEKISVVPWNQVDIGALLREAGLLITDFSSVNLDFVYMNKPILYYQFDTEAFRAGHHSEGYFDYEKDGFGPVCHDCDTLLREMEKIFSRGTGMEEKYAGRANSFFRLRDRENCRRTYAAVCQMLEKK